MNKIIIVLIILVGNFVNLYYMGQNAEKESEQDLTVANFENIQSEDSIIEEKQEVLDIVDTNESKEIENNSIIEDKINNIKQENSEVATYSVTNTIKKAANNQKNIMQENNNQVVEEVNTAIVKQNEIENNKDSTINKEIPQENVLVEENTAPTEEYKINEKKIAEIRNIINSNPSEDMKLYGYEIVVDSSITEVTTQFTFTEKRVKDKIAWKFGTIRIYAQDYYRNGKYITTECYLI